MRIRASGYAQTYSDRPRLLHCKVHIAVARANRHFATTLGHLGLACLLPHATSIPRPRLLYSSARIVLVPHRLRPVARPSCI